MKRTKLAPGFWSSVICSIVLFASFGICTADVIISPNTNTTGKIIMLTPTATDTASANGTALLAALAGISASSTNQYLLKLGPGIYDIGTSSLIMKSYVDIEGSGENATTIQGNVNSATAGVVNGVTSAELRFLSVQNYGGGTYAKAVYIQNASPKITHVTVNAYGGSATTTGIEISAAPSSASPVLAHVTVRIGFSGPPGTTVRGIDINGNAMPVLSDIDIQATNGSAEISGIYSNGAQPKMRGVSIHVWNSGGQGPVNYGIYSLASWTDMSNLKILAQGPSTAIGVYTDTTGILRIDHSEIDGETVSISNGTTAYIGGTKIWRGVTKRSGSIACMYCYTEGVLLDINCAALP